MSTVYLTPWNGCEGEQLREKEKKTDQWINVKRKNECKVARANGELGKKKRTYGAVSDIWKSRKSTSPCSHRFSLIA